MTKDEQRIIGAWIMDGFVQAIRRSTWMIPTARNEMNSTSKVAATHRQFQIKYHDTLFDERRFFVPAMTGIYVDADGESISLCDPETMQGWFKSIDEAKAAIDKYVQRHP